MNATGPNIGLNFKNGERVRMPETSLPQESNVTLMHPSSTTLGLSKKKKLNFSSVGTMMGRFGSTNL